jgi:hypothetical protein
LIGAQTSNYNNLPLGYISEICSEATSLKIIATGIRNEGPRDAIVNKKEFLPL